MSNKQKETIKVAVLFNSARTGGFVDEDIKYAEDAEANARRIVNKLTQAGELARLVEITEEDLNQQIREVKKWADVVFNLTEAVGLGLVLEVIGALEELAVPFAGASKYGHKVTSDKSLIKEVMRDNGIPTPHWYIYTKQNYKQGWSGKYPAIVKATTEHGSMSIHQDSVVTNDKQLKQKIEYLLEKYDGLPVMAEEYIDGREINSTVIGSFGWAKVLPLSEMVFEGSYKNNNKWPIYTYEAKYNHNTPDFDDVPARLVNWLTSKETELIERMSLAICDKTECFDYARTDIRYDTKNRIPYFVDLNSYPCLLEDTKYDTIGISRAALGWDYTRLIKEIAWSGVKRHHLWESYKNNDREAAYALR